MDGDLFKTIQLKFLVLIINNFPTFFKKVGIFIWKFKNKVIHLQYEIETENKTYRPATTKK